MTTINLSNDQLTTVVATSILQSLTPEVQREMITKAISEALQRTEGAYGTSPLQRAFSQAVVNVATKQIEDRLASDDAFKADVESLLVEATAKALTGDGRAKTVECIAGGIRKALTGDRY